MRDDQEIWVVSKGPPMPTLTIEYRDENERLAPEQAIAYVSDLHQLAVEAPSGTVLDACEGRALDKGRALLRSTLAAALGSRVALAEQKGGRTHLPRGAPRTLPGTTPADHPDRRRARHPDPSLFLLPGLRSGRLRRRPHPRHRWLRHPR